MLFFRRKEKKGLSLASKILIGMVLGLLVGIIIKLLPESPIVNTYFVNGAFDVIGQIFIQLFKMLIVPIVFVAIVCGVTKLGCNEKLGRLGFKTLSLFVITNVIAVSIGLFLATIFDIGHGHHVSLSSHFTIGAPITFKHLLLSLVPSNPFQAMAQGNMLQVIIFSVLFGIAISLAGKSGKKIADLFEAANDVLIKLIFIVLKIAPYGVFCLMVVVVDTIGIQFIANLVAYILVIILALIIQLFLIYSLFLVFVARLNPFVFYKKMLSAMIFAFSTSSSNATIPVTLNVTERKLGVKNSIAAFIIPLGANINLNGTAIMQGVACVFIAHLYNIPLGFTTYFIIIAMVTLTSMSSAGIPSSGIITLAIVLRQAGLPLEGIALIFGVDRLVDMMRTIVNISGDAMIACLVGKSEKEFDKKVYQGE